MIRFWCLYFRTWVPRCISPTGDSMSWDDRNLVLKWGRPRGCQGLPGAGGDRRSGRRSSFFDILAFGYGSIPIKIQFLVGWTSIYQLFWCELQGYKVLTHWHLGSRAFVKIWCIEFDVRTSILRQWWLNLVTTRMQLDYSSSDGVNTQNRYPLVI